MSKGDSAVYIIASGGGSKAISDILTHGGASSYFVGAEIPYAQQEFDKVVGGEVWDGKYCTERTAHQLAAAAYDRAFAHGQLNSIGIGVTASLAKRESQRPGRVNHVYIAVMNSWFFSYTFHYTFNSTTPRLIQEEDCCTMIKAIMDDELIRQDPQDVPELFGVKPKSYWVNSPSIKDLGKFEKRFVFPGSFNPLHARHRDMIDYVYNKYNQYPIVEIALKHHHKPSVSPFEYCQRQKQIRTTYPGIWITYSTEPLMIDKHHSYRQAFMDDTKVIMMMGADTFEKVDNKDKDEMDILVFPRDGIELSQEYIDLCPRTKVADMTPHDISATEIRKQLRE
jgi:nicotinic acid mononucleotide adenylyltransferase